MTTFKSESSDTVLKYPSSFQKTAISEDAGQSKNVEVLFRATEGYDDQPLLVRLQKETGLRIVSSLTNIEFIDNLLRNTEKAYPLRFPEYSKLSEKKFDYKGKKAAELYFTYVGPAGEKIKQRVMIIEYDPDIALYLTAQAKETDFDKLNRKYFDRMFKNLEFVDN